MTANKDLANARQIPQRTVNSCIREKMDILLEEGRINSWYRYRSMLKALEEHGGKKIWFRNITPQWLKDCELFWKSEGRNSTTVNVYMKSLRSILVQEYPSEDIIPFGKGKYQIPKAHSRKIALSSSELKKVINWKGKEKLMKYRDLWLFSYLCNGINFKDLVMLKYSNIKAGEIRFERSKTRHASASYEIKAYVSKEMMAIIDRWGTPRGQGGYIFGFLRGDESPAEKEKIVRNVVCKCNRATRKIAKELGIQYFSTYSARHSFATTLMRKGVSISYISECLGHTSIKTTETYLAGFEREDRKRFSACLTDL